MGSDTRGLARADARCRFLHPPGAVGQGKESGVRRQSRDSCIACFKADLAAQGKRMGARRGAFLDVIVEPSELVAALSAHRAVAGGSLTVGADGVELLVRVSALRTSRPR